MSLSFSNKTFFDSPKDNPKDRIQIEVGDSKQADFYPQVKLMRWNNEVNSSLRLVYDALPGNISFSENNGVITWKKGLYEARFYNKPEASEEGGFEFEVYLPQKPPINTLSFSINTKSLNWFYQPELTAQEKADGANRPDNVIGSYAVYHSTKGGLNDVSGMDYKVGKAFHVYRPHVVDAAMHETWADLSLDEKSGILTITVPWSFLNSCVYPVIVDPTFGYTSVGGSSSTFAGGNIITGGGTTTGGAGVAVGATIYTNMNTSAANIQMALYDNSSPSNFVLGGSTLSVVVDSSIPSWKTALFNNLPPTSSSEYYICFNNNQPTTRPSFYYDAGSNYKYTASVFGTWPSTITWSSAATPAIFSLYVTYKEVGMGFFKNILRPRIFSPGLAR